MGINQLYNDNLWKLPNKYGDVSVMDNIFGNNVFLMNIVLLKFRFLHSNHKCAKWVEISGWKMDLTCSAGYSLVVHVQHDVFFGLSLILCMIFKTCSQFSENVTVEKFIKILLCTTLFTCTH